MRNIIKHNNELQRTNERTNERTHFFIKTYLSHFIRERVDVGWLGCSIMGQADSHAGILSPNWLQLQLELTQAVCGTNERTHFFIKIYLSHFIRERVDVGCVWEVSWRQRQTATYWPKVPLTIAALLSHLGWVAQSWVTEGLKPSVCKLILMLASCPPTDSNSNWNWPKPSVAPGYIIVSCPPASAVPPLIYTGASLDWQFGRGSVYNNCNHNYIFEVALFIHLESFICIQLYDIKYTKH